MKFTNLPSPLLQAPTTPSSMSTSDMSSLDDLDNLTDLLQMPSSQELTNFVTWDMDMSDIKQESPERNVVTSTSTSCVSISTCIGGSGYGVGVGTGLFVLFALGQLDGWTGRRRQK